jgi:hypothetical protein
VFFRCLIGFCLIFSVQVYGQDSLSKSSGTLSSDTATLLIPKYIPKVYKVAPLSSSWVIRKKQNKADLRAQLSSLNSSFQNSNFNYSLVDVTPEGGIQGILGQIQVQKGEGRPKFRGLPDWNFYIVGLLLFLWIFISRKYQYFLSLSRQAFWSDRILNVFIKSSEFLTSQGALISFLLGFLILSLSIHFFNTESLNYNNTILNYLYTFIVIFAISFFRLIIIRVSSFLLETKEIFNTYLAIISSSFITVSIYVLPLLVLYLMVPLHLQVIILWILIISPILLLVYQYFRSSYFILSTFAFPKFYLFLYLCALEIAPMLLMIKAFLQ